MRRFTGLGAIGADYFSGKAGWPILRDKGPHIHVADNGSVAYWLGCTGTGVAMSTHAGKLLADSL